MKQNKYIQYHEIEKGVFLHYNSYSDSFLVLNESTHDIFVNHTPDEIEMLNSKLYGKLVDSYFLIKDDVDEAKQILDWRTKQQKDTKMYHIMVNPTLDCNLNCWYCYENRVKGSKISEEIILRVKKNIEVEYERNKYTTLKVSFFGGEPFVRFDAIRSLLEFARGFCEKNGVTLLADFTTNATLITEEIVDFLSDYPCQFQITLDGGEESHNKVKHDGNKNHNSYRRTINALKLINEKIEDRYVAVRLNFDSKTINDIDDIIHDIKFLDRKKTFVIVKKIWQVDTEQMSGNVIIDVIEKLFNEDFLVDYYYMPKGALCFAERDSEALVNYNGLVFKCSTVTSFDEENSLGVLEADGEISWKKEQMDGWRAEMQPDYCIECKWFGACRGICNRQLMAHKGEKICTFDAMNLTPAEYLMYLFNYKMVQKKIFSESK